MERHRVLRLGVAATLLALVGCDRTENPLAHDGPTIRPGSPPAYSVVDPGAQVNTTISVAPMVCSGTGTVTVSIAGVRPPPQGVPLDLMLVLDESGSINDADWTRIRDASLDLLVRMDAADGAVDGNLTNIRIGVILFANNARYTLALTGNYTQVRSVLQWMTRTGGGTNITAALDLARTELLAGGAANAAKAVVFMTDGMATRGGTTDAAQLASAAGVKNLPARLFIVGVGNVNASLLQQMASPQSFVPMSNFDGLATAFDEIATQALEFPAARALTFSAQVPAGFTLVPGTASASKGSATQTASGVSWSVAELLEETITLTYQIQHDATAEPLGGTLTAVSGAQLALTTPVSHNPYSETLDDATAQVNGCDLTPPEITPNLTGTLGNNGWYVSNVQVSWLVADAESPVTLQQGCDASAVTSDTPGASFTCEATSTGGTASGTVVVKRDATAPVVAYAGNAGTYALTDAVNITCSASDALSGVATSTCSAISGPAWTFGAGARTFSAQATDHAGNTGTGSVSFTVQVSYAGLCALVTSEITHQGTVNSLCATLRAAESAAARGNHTTARNQLGAFINHVRAQTGKTVPTGLADILIELANALK